MDRATGVTALGRPAGAAGRRRCRRRLQRLIALSCALAGLALLASCLLPSSQPHQPAKVARIGLLFGALPEASPQAEAFRQGLREIGYVEGQNVAIEFRSAAGREDRLLDLARELVRLQVHLIVASSTPSILAAKDAVAEAAARDGTEPIPIVMATSGDPVETGLVASLARPGGNVTGLSIIAPQLGGKRLELLKEAFPGVSRVGVLWNTANPGKALEWRETQVAAQALGVELESLEVREPTDFRDVLTPATRDSIDGLVVLGDPLMTRQRAQILDFAARSALPAMYETREWTAAGGLMAYGPSLLDLYRRAPYYVDKILKGTKPADLPVEQPTRFELSVSLKAAQAQGLTISRSVLLQANEVIQ